MSADMDMTAVGALLVGCAVFGAILGTDKSMGPVGGFIIGGLLGPIGIVIVLASGGKEKPTTLQRVQARPEGEGWHPDPLGRFDGRYFDGNEWTQHVGRVGADGTRQTFEDPL